MESNSGSESIPVLEGSQAASAASDSSDKVRNILQADDLVAHWFRRLTNCEPHEADVSKVADQALTKAVANFDSTKGEWLSFLSTVARNKVRDFLRIPKPLIASNSFDQCVSREGAPDRHLELADVAALVEAVLDRLPPGDVNVWRASKIDDQEYAIIAEKFGRTYRAVVQAVHRVNKELQAALGDE